MSGVSKIINRYINEQYQLPKKFGDYVFFYFNDEMVIVYNYETKNVLRSTTFVTSIVNIFGVNENLVNQILTIWCDNKINGFSDLKKIQSLF